MSDNAERIERIRQLLTEALAPTHLDIVDDSARHRGHPGARSGGGHFNVEVIAEAFAGQSRIARHRQVYAALGNMMTQDIHALSIRAHTPQEAAQS